MGNADPEYCDDVEDFEDAFIVLFNLPLCMDV